MLTYKIYKSPLDKHIPICYAVHEIWLVAHNLEELIINMDFENQSLANRPIPQAPAARPIPTHGQEIPPDWRSQHPVLQAILSFAQPILLRLVERKNVRLSVTRHQDQTSWNFSFTEDSNDE